jgi:Cu-processing system permease protein
MIASVWAIALNGFREARRNRVSVVLGAFAIALLFASSLLAQVTVYTMNRVVTDFGLGAMAIILSLLAVFLSSGLLSREIERRTIFLVVSKPVSRGGFLVGRLMGNMITLGTLLVVMAAAFFVQLVFFGLQVTGAQLTAVGVLSIELLVLSSVGLLMSTCSGQIVSAVVTVGVYFVGHLTTDLYDLAIHSRSVPLRTLGTTLYYVLPNLERLNYRPAAAYELVPAMSEVLSSVAYGCAYSVVVTALAVLIFSRRDFR